MGERKDDDFWKSSSGDDFWNKPVADDGWLKEEENSFWDTDKKSTDFSGVSKEFLQEEKTFENPYLKKNSYVYQDAGRAQQQKKEDKPAANQKKEKKRVHVHTIICLTAILIAALSAATAVVSVKRTQAKALAVALALSYKEETVADEFSFNENNRIYLEDEAYTIVTGESFKGFPDGIKLIAVYTEVESDAYIRDSYVMKDMYIGFEENGGKAYKKPARSDMISAYIYGYGFDNDRILSIYGIGNGIDYAGYYFFFVPEEVEEITVYIEKKETIHKIPVINTVYRKNLTVLPEDEELTEELAEREVWW